jgi:hypothetical protein
MQRDDSESLSSESMINKIISSTCLIKQVKKLRKKKDSEEKRRLKRKLIMQNNRKDEIKREIERVRDKEARSIKRQNVEIKAREQVQNTIDHRERKEDEVVRAAIQAKNTTVKQITRLDPDYRATEQEKDTPARQTKRLDPEYRAKEQEKDTPARQTKRLDQEYREKERERDRVDHLKKRNSIEYIIKRYEQGILEGPNHICVCCGGLFFHRSLLEFCTNLDISNKLVDQMCCVKIHSNGKLWICQTCYKYAINRQFPRLWLNGGLQFPVVDACINELNDLEERLCSPRIAFLRIKPLKWDKQKGLRGNVVNVPVDVEKTLQQLPREFDTCETIHLKFMRKMDYNNAYIQDTVRPAAVRTALKSLMEKTLFQQLDIQVSSQYLQQSAIQPIINFAYSSDDEERIDDGSDIEIIQRKNKVMDNSDDDSESSQSSNDDNDDEENDITNTQIHETLLVQDFAIAPGEESCPLPLVSDLYAEEATFIKIFGGEIIQDNLPSNITCVAKCKSFFRRYDRRCAENVTYIFYMYKKLMAEKLISAINYCLKKFKVKNNLTVNDVLTNSTTMQQLIRTNDMKQFLRNIRSSPVYWESKKKELFAMIRQLGCPSFFITLSPAEVDWPELIVILVQNLENRKISIKDANIMDRETKLDLLRRDPVTTARYFENRMRYLLNFTFNKTSGPFSENPITDYYWRVEFQTRGSPHIHMVVWCKDHKEYNRSDPKNPGNIDCLVMIDKYVTCCTNQLNEPEINDNCETTDEMMIKKLIKYQRHRHKRNCQIEDREYKSANEFEYKEYVEAQEGEEDVINKEECVEEEQIETEENKMVCKYGFPWPILDHTIILEPIQCMNNNIEKEAKKKAKRDYLMIKHELEKIAKDQERCIKNQEEMPNTFTLRQFLIQLHLNMDEYIMALRSSIRQSKVFLNRNSSEIMINPYNKMIFVRHRANMDIQFVLDSHAIVAYVTSYMMKSNATMSRLLNIACEEITKGNETIKRQLYRLANKFQNCTEISAQECVYHLIGLPVSFCTRKFQFIMSFHEYERFTTLKNKEILQLMNPNSTEIYQKGIIDYYMFRPRSTMSETCLAEFISYYNIYSPERYEMEIKKHFISDLAFDEDEHDDDELDDLLNQSTDDDNDDDNVNNESVNESSEPMAINHARIKKPKVFIALEENMGYVEKRMKSKVIRYRRYKKSTEPKEYYREQLLLFYPWYNETTEIEEVDHFEQFQDKQEIIALNRAKFENVIRTEKDEEALERIQNEIEEQFVLNRTEEACERYNANERLLEDDDETDDEDKQDVDDDHDSEFLEDEYGFHAVLETPNVTAHMIDKDNSKNTTNTKRLDDTEYMQLITRLNRRQHRYLMNVINCIKNGEIFHHFVSGGSGYGKSVLIKATEHSINRFLDKFHEPSIDDNTENDPLHLILTAYTGKAAFHIRGETLHRAFGLSRSKVLEDLTTKSLKNFKLKYKNMRLLIIDEVSMIDSTMFSHIDKRLRQIFKQPDTIFGGISVLVVGDFNQKQPVSGS